MALPIGEGAFSAPLSSFVRGTKTSEKRAKSGRERRLFLEEQEAEEKAQADTEEARNKKAREHREKLVASGGQSGWKKGGREHFKKVCKVSNGNTSDEDDQLLKNKQDRHRQRRRAQNFGRADPNAATTLDQDVDAAAKGKKPVESLTPRPALQLEDLANVTITNGLSSNKTSADKASSFNRRYAVYIGGVTVVLVAAAAIVLIIRLCKHKKSRLKKAITASTS